MLTGIHFLLTYQCNLECDHCFLYCSPESKGTFTIDHIKSILDDLKNIESIDRICFEGGEPFLYYSLLKECIKLASTMGYESAIESNAFWATTVEDAKSKLEPLVKLGLSFLEVSDDAFHHDGKTAKNAITAAEKIGLNVSSICVEKARLIANNQHVKGEPIYSGGPKLRGRAIDKLTKEMPLKSWEDFNTCPHEDLKDPGRVHIDSYGNVHLCQGLLMGSLELEYGGILIKLLIEKPVNFLIETSFG